MEPCDHKGLDALAYKKIFQKRFKLKGGVGNGNTFASRGTIIGRKKKTLFVDQVQLGQGKMPHES